MQAAIWLNASYLSWARERYDVSDATDRRVSMRSQLNHLSLWCLCKWWPLWHNLIQEISNLFIAIVTGNPQMRQPKRGAPYYIRWVLIVYHIPFWKTKSKMMETWHELLGEKKKDTCLKILTHIWQIEDRLTSLALYKLFESYGRNSKAGLFP